MHLLYAYLVVCTAKRVCRKSGRFTVLRAGPVMACVRNSATLAPVWPHARRALWGVPGLRGLTALTWAPIPFYSWKPVDTKQHSTKRKMQCEMQSKRKNTKAYGQVTSIAQLIQNEDTPQTNRDDSDVSASPPDTTSTGTSASPVTFWGPSKAFDSAAWSNPARAGRPDALGFRSIRSMPTSEIRVGEPSLGTEVANARLRRMMLYFSTMSSCLILTSWQVWRLSSRETQSWRLRRMDGSSLGSPGNSLSARK